MQWIAISGSLRRGSFNTRLARLMARQAPEGVEVEVATPEGIPLYNGDEEADHGIPQAVEALRARIKSSGGLIIVTPEYNAGMPGVLKNALDWLTRPGEEMQPTFARPTALAGATPGGWGTGFAQAGALINLRQLGCRLFPDHLRVSKAGARFDDQEADNELAREVGGWLERFAEFAGPDAA